MERIMDRRGFVKWTTLAGATAALFALSGCGTPRSASSESVREPQVTEDPEKGAAEMDANDSATTNSRDASGAHASGKALVAVFSWSGNTLQVAERISDLTGADLFRIEPVTPYTTVYDDVLDVARAEQQAGELPPVAGSVEDWNQYETVFLGYPIWWYDAPQIIKSFAASYDFAGKTVVPFCTSGGSQLSTSLPSVEEACASARFLEGVTIPGSAVSSHLDEVDTWLSGLGIS